MSKKTFSNESNNKLFDRHFTYDITSAPFNNNILNERAFSKNEKYLLGKDKNIGNRLVNGVDKWKDEMILDDRKMFSKINVKDDKILNDRIFNMKPNVNISKVEGYFRNLSKKNTILRKNSVNDNNYVNEINYDYANDLSMKMLTFYQYKLKKMFLCSGCGLMMLLAILSMASNEKNRFKNINLNTNISDSVVNQFTEKNKDLFISSFIIINNKNQINDKFKKYCYMINCKNPKKELSKINAIINKKSMGNMNIDNIFNDSMFDNMNIILLNTIYFKTKWKFNFKILEKDFYDLVKTKKINMMLANINTNYYENDDKQIIEIEQENNNIYLGIILNKKLNSIILPPKQNTLQKYINLMTKKNINLQLPKFTCESYLFPRDILNLLDINISNIDLSNMINNVSQININNIIQKTKIIFEENNNINTSINDTNINSLNFIANHPFLYYIRNYKTNNILFCGIYK